MSSCEASLNPEMESAMVQLGRLYGLVENKVTSQGPVCELSARCCRFREFGHDLFLTALEHEYLLASGEPAVEPLRAGENCPWQASSGVCMARAGRPLGCRVYFCDPNFAETMPEIMEEALTQLKQIHNQMEIPWDYRPLHLFLTESREKGRWVEPSQAPCDTVGESTDNGGRPVLNVLEAGYIPPRD